MTKLKDLLNKEVVIEAADFFGPTKPSIMELIDRNLSGGELRWSESQRSWAYVRLARGLLIEDVEKESQLLHIPGNSTPRNTALWFHPNPGQSVKYCIRITQNHIDQGLIKHVEEDKPPSETLEVAPEERPRKINWRRNDEV